MKKNMTTEERVLTALRCDQPDRVPVILYLNPYLDPNDPHHQPFYVSDPSYAEVLDACKEYADVMYECGFPKSGFFHTGPVEKETRQIADGITEYIIHAPAGPLTSRVQTDWRGGGTLKRWICEPADVEKVLSIPYTQRRPDLTHILDARKQDKWVVELGCVDPICASTMINEEILALWTIEQRDLLRTLFDAAQERILYELKYCLENGAGPLYHFSGPELALPPLMSPADFEEFVVAYDTQLVKLIHSYPGNYVIMHSHGRVSKFLERFAAIGINGLNVLEPPPIGDTILSDAKKRIGDRVCLIGNIQYDDLARNDEGQIERLVQKAMEEGAPGGGFILSPCASPYERPLPAKTSRNFIHYLKMGRKHGIYG